MKKRLLLLLAVMPSMHGMQRSIGQVAQRMLAPAIVGQARLCSSKKPGDDFSSFGNIVSPTVKKEFAHTFVRAKDPKKMQDEKDNAVDRSEAAIQILQENNPVSYCISKECFERFKSDLDSTVITKVDAWIYQRLSVSDLFESLNFVPDSSQQLPFFVAAFFGKKNHLKMFLEAGADLEVKTKEGRTALMLAAMSGKCDAVKLLVESGANLETRDNDGVTVLIRTALAGKSDVINLLVASGANLEARDNNGMTALMRAVLADKLDALYLSAAQLVNQDLDALVSFGKLLGSPSQQDLFDAVKLLVKLGANLEAKDNQGYTALMRAVLADNFDAVQLLVELGANLETENNNRMTAIDIANNKEFSKSATYFKGLLEVKSLRGDSQFNVHDAIKLLLDLGADLKGNGLSDLDSPEARDFFYIHSDSELAKAKEMFYLKGVYKLIEFKKRRDSSIVTETDALIYGSSSLSELFESLDNVQDTHEKSPIFIAAVSGKKGHLKVFLDRGVDLEAKDKKGRTVLNVASLLGKSKAVKLLVGFGAKLEIADDNRNAELISPNLVGLKDW